MRISLQQHFRHDLSIEEYVAVQRWWCREYSILVIDVVTDDDRLHLWWQQHFILLYRSIFRRRTRSSGWSASRSQMPQVSVDTIFHIDYGWSGIRWGNILSFWFASLASPAPARSFYASALTSNSLIFCRSGNCSVNRYFYYQPIGFTTTTSGDYDIRSNSSLDTYGYIFNSTVHQITGVSGAVMFDDDSGGYHQFRMTVSVRPMFNYTLIVTTYAANITGPFSISATGDPPLTFFPW